MHIYKYGQSYIIILHQYISVTLVTVVRMDALMMVRFPRAQHWILQSERFHRSLFSIWCRPLFWRAALSTAERAALSVAVQQLMSSALLTRNTEYCRSSGFIGRCASSRLRAVSALSLGLSMPSRKNYEGPHCVIFPQLLLTLSLLNTGEWKPSQLTNSSPSLSLCLEWRCTDVVINWRVTNSTPDVWLIIRRSCSEWEWSRCERRAGRSADSNRAKML